MNFLLFRLPNTKEFYWIENKNIGRNLASFFPFDKGLILNIFSDEVQEISKEKLSEKLRGVLLPKIECIQNIPSREEYLAKVEKAIRLVKENQWQKLVISRPIYSPVENLDLVQTFFQLSEQYPNTLCYIWKDEKRLWIGATPEILGVYNKENSEFQTMSLAGTLLADEVWTEKEKEEQKAVTQYISGILHKYSQNVENSAVFEHFLGKIKHLRTDFKARIKDEDLALLINDLHPTPAVCGFPKDLCKQKISEIETYDREYYSGYIKIETKQKIYFFVNLRCMKLFDEGAKI